ncbi:MAG: flagellar protein FlaG [Alphaproteobacteria bacterium]|nr:flagellar protein FlaG [Alphaproteobacteria bacterium]MBU1513919.1 flagellar protein FlaG [Alphaproteobacteria bacterium]MBU2094185.1 flagellar protein FlaG [Alphaproteobacteria bacterium]MBU2150483.1 flagellar protein FlaG [Alphaproteobacteria bacterium]MBU2307675.1 flagellar protein FlaG [Alphaproteobacteria bacterium]
METKAATVTPTPDPGKTQAQPAAPPAKSESPVAQGPDPAEMRLVIEMDQASGSFVYKTVNRLTGEVILQLPRDEVLKMRDGGQYEAGAVIQTKA